MDTLLNMRLFARVARLESFTAAAEELRLSTTAVSRRVRELEEHLGAALLRRTTREVSLTETGRGYLERCEQLLAEVEALEESVRGPEHAHGLLRVSVGVDFGRRRILPMIPSLLEEHPDLELDVQLTDRHVELVSEGVDVAVRIGKLQDSSLIARQVASCEHHLVASAELLANLGATTPAEIDPAMYLVDRNQPKTWTLHRDEDEQVVRPAGRVAVNSAEGIVDLAAAGVGIALVPDFMLDDQLETGRLVELLPQWRYPQLGIYAIYPENRHLSARVRVFVHAVAEALRPDA